MKKSFTLLELLVVIGILGIMLLAVAGNFLTSIKRGRDARRQSDLKAVQSCMEQFYSVNGKYENPVTTPLTNGTGGTPVVTIHCGDNSNTVSVQDPINGNQGGVNYQYTIAVSDTSFLVSANLETGPPASTFTVRNQQ